MKRPQPIRSIIRRIGLILLLGILFVPGLLSAVGLCVGDYEVVFIIRRTTNRMDACTMRCINAHLIFEQSTLTFDQPQSSSRSLKLAIRRLDPKVILGAIPPRDLMFFTTERGMLERSALSNDRLQFKALIVSSYVCICVGTLTACFVFLRVRKWRRNRVARGFDILIDSPATGDSSTSE